MQDRKCEKQAYGNICQREQLKFLFTVRTVDKWNGITEIRYKTQKAATQEGYKRSQKQAG